MAKRGPYAKGVAKREEILDIAIEVVARDGYDRTSVREIAREAELSQAGLLHYFSSKEELFVEVVRRRDQSNAASIDQAHPIESLARVMRENAQTPGLVRLFATISAESTDVQHPGHAFFAYRYATIRARVAEGIREEQERGELGVDLDAEDLATIFLALADGLQVQWLLDPTRDMSGLIVELWEALGRAATRSDPAP
jgi:AcrR family transcriptional regulator